MVARLAELFLAQAIRDYVQGLPASSQGWLRGLTDPAVSKALSIIHNRFAEELEVEALAREAGVSRTVLGERFAELLGELPMRYCARWRMRMAANLLRDSKQSSGNVAYAWASKAKRRSIARSSANMARRPRHGASAPPEAAQGSIGRRCPAAASAVS